MKVISFLLIIIISNPCFSKDLTVCLADRIVKSIPYYGKSFVNGAELAISTFTQKDRVKLKTYFYDWEPLDAIKAFKAMQDDSCSVIVGFSYLTDAMLVDRRNVSLKIFSPFAGFYGTPKLSNNFFTFKPPLEKFSESIIKLSLRIGKKRPYIVFVEENRNSSLEYLKAYKNSLRSRHIKFKVFHILEGSNKIESVLADNSSVLSKSNIILLSGVVTSSKIINSLSDKENIFFGTENFGSSTAKSIFNRINNKKEKIYFARNLDYIDKTNHKLSSFRTLYKSKYNTDPTVLSAYTFDAVSASLEAYKLNPLEKLDFSNPSYNGITGIAFKNNTYSRSHLSL